MNDPLVSIIVAVFNGQNFIDQAIESVLNQSYQGFEVVIVDDGSTEQTAEVAKSYLNKANIKYIYQENGGHGAALNTGILNSNSEFIAFIDHDDLWDSNKLQLQIDAFKDESDLDVVFTCLKNFSENNHTDKLQFQKGMMQGYMTGTMLIRRNAFFEVGFFNTELSKGYFSPWFDRLNMLGLKRLTLPHLLYHRRVHGNNISIGRDNNDYKDYFSAIREIRNQRN